jgi:hypothetical protein
MLRVGFLIISPLLIEQVAIDIGRLPGGHATSSDNNAGQYWCQMMETQARRSDCTMHAPTGSPAMARIPAQDM